MNDLDPKSPLKSRGVWGGIGATLFGFTGLWGYTVTPEDVQSIYQLIVSIGSSISGILAIIGRIKAKRVIG